MLNITPEALLAFMKKQKYEAAIQPDTSQVYTILKIDRKEYPLFLRIFEEGPLLQLLVFIPCPLEKEIAPDMGRLLHLLNKELDVPGFGMDENAGVIFYRLMLPAQAKKIDEELLTTFLKTTEHVCKMFSNPIEAVAFRHATLDEILKKAQEMEQEHSE